MRRADHSSRGVIPSVVSNSEASIMRRPCPLGAIAPLEKKKISSNKVVFCSKQVLVVRDYLKLYQRLDFINTKNVLASCRISSMLK